MEVSGEESDLEDFHEEEFEEEDELSDEEFEARLDAALQEDSIPFTKQKVLPVKEEPQSLMAQLLSTLSDPEARSAIIHTAYQAGLGRDDPLFVVLLATGQLELLLKDKPVQIEKLFQGWRERWQQELKESQVILEQEREQIRLLLDDTEEVARLQTKAALDLQKRNISKTVNELIRKAALEKVAHDAWALIRAGTILLSSIGIGMALGLAIPLFASPPEIDPSGPRQLTLEEAKALEWGMSELGKYARSHPEVIEWAKSGEGKYARELVQWNQALLSGKSEKWCEREIKKIGLTLKLEGKSAQRGVCLLWTRPPEERGLMSD